MRPAAPPPVKAGFAVAGDDPKPFVPHFPGAAHLAELETAAAGQSARSTGFRIATRSIRRVPLVFRVGDQFYPDAGDRGAARRAGRRHLCAQVVERQRRDGLRRSRPASTISGSARSIVPTDADGGIWLQFRRIEPDAYIPAWKVLAGENDPDESRRAHRPGRHQRARPHGSPRDAARSPSIAGRRGSRPGARAHPRTASSSTRPGLSHGARAGDHGRARPRAIVVLPRVGALTSAADRRGGRSARRASAALVRLQPVRLSLRPVFPGAESCSLVISPARSTSTGGREQQRGEVRSAFGYYVSPTVVNEISRAPRKARSSAARCASCRCCSATCAISPRISERLTAHELTRFINSLLTPLSEIILENRGTIDKYMGDASWRSGTRRSTIPTTPQRAASALAMIDGAGAPQRRVGGGGGGGRPARRSRSRIGIGINSGNCCVGNLGSSQRFDYSAIGDDVNVASRLEGLSKVYGVDSCSARTRRGRRRDMAADRTRPRAGQGPRHAAAHLHAARRCAGAASAAHPVAGETCMRPLAAYRRQDGRRPCGDRRCEALGLPGGALRGVRRRIAEFERVPPPPDWDGAFVATTKQG